MYRLASENLKVSIRTHNGACLANMRCSYGKVRGSATQDPNRDTHKIVRVIYLWNWMNWTVLPPFDCGGDEMHTRSSWSDEIKKGTELN